MGKLETSEEDNRYIMLKAGFPKELIDPERRLNESGGGSTSDAAKEYFKTLSKELVQKLYKYYSKDFILFDYDFKEYLQIAKDN